MRTSSDEHDEGAFFFPSGSHAIRKGSGITASEQYLAQLAERTFLSLWSYPNIYRSQDKNEVCDLLVVFEKDVIIFSDKDVEYKPHAEPKVAWRRWYKKAVKKAAEQIYGAERWIKEHPDCLFSILCALNRFQPLSPSLSGCEFIVSLWPMAHLKPVGVPSVAAAV